MSICIEGKLRGPVIAWLESLGMTPVFEVCLSGQCDIVGVSFENRIGRAIPKIKQIAAVELKIDDIAGVLRQATSNRHHVPNSYAAMPVERLSRMRLGTIEKFRAAGVGLIAVGENVASVVVHPVNSEVNTLRLTQKLWRRRDEWRGRLNSTKW